MQDVSSLAHTIFVPAGFVCFVVEIFHVYSSVGRHGFCGTAGCPDYSHSSRRLEFRRLDQSWCQELGEKEWRNVVRADLQFISLFRLASLRGDHNTCIVPQHIQFVFLA